MVNQLLDTTVLIDYFRGYKVAIEYIANLNRPTISIISEAEIYEEVRNTIELGKVVKTFEQFFILPITEEISRISIDLLKRHRLAHGLHTLDAFVIATALVHNLAMVTSNTKHFRFVKELKLISWQ